MKDIARAIFAEGIKMVAAGHDNAATRNVKAFAPHVMTGNVAAAAALLADDLVVGSL